MPISCIHAHLVRSHAKVRSHSLHREKRQRPTATHRRTDLSPTASDHLEKSTVVPSRSHTLKSFAYTRRRVVVWSATVHLSASPRRNPHPCGNENSNELLTKRCQVPRHLLATCLRVGHAVGSGFKSPIISMLSARLKPLLPRSWRRKTSATNC